MAVVILTTASSSPWAVPSHFIVNTNHIVHLVGSGGSGGTGTGGSATNNRPGGGGGGGQAVKLTYSSGTITPGTTTIAFKVATANAGDGTASNRTQWEGTAATNDYQAHNGATGGNAVSGGAAGAGGAGGTGTNTNGTPTITYTVDTARDGGTGGTSGSAASRGGGGGGGSGGPTAAGGNGFGSGDGTGGGGGGANNGASGNASSQTGGTGSTGTGGGAGNPGGNGTGCSGGGGGNQVRNSTGGNGGSGDEFTDGGTAATTAGPGGGGGGGGNDTVNETTTVTGGTGGSYGGGGGGCGGVRGTITNVVGPGAAGVIVIFFNSTVEQQSRGYDSSVETLVVKNAVRRAINVVADAQADFDSQIPKIDAPLPLGTVLFDIQMILAKPGVVDRSFVAQVPRDFLPTVRTLPGAFYDGINRFPTVVDADTWAAIAPQNFTFSGATASFDGIVVSPALLEDSSWYALSTSVQMAFSGPLASFDGISRKPILVEDSYGLKLDPPSVEAALTLPSSFFDGIVKYRIPVEDSFGLRLDQVTQNNTQFFGWSTQLPFVKQKAAPVSGFEIRVPKVDVPTWVNYELSYQLKKPFSPTQQQFLTFGTSIAVATPAWVNYELSYQFKKPLNPARQQFTTLSTRAVVAAGSLEWFFKQDKDVFYKPFVIDRAFVAQIPINFPPVSGTISGAFFDGVSRFPRVFNIDVVPPTPLSTVVSATMPHGFFDGMTRRLSLIEDSYALRLDATQVNNTQVVGWSVPQPLVKQGIVTVSGSETDIPKVDIPTWVNYELSYKFKNPLSPTQQQFHALNIQPATPASTGGIATGFFDGLVMTGAMVAYDRPPVPPLSTVVSGSMPHGFFDGINRRSLLTEDSYALRFDAVQASNTQVVGWSVNQPLINQAVVSVSGSETEVPKVDVPTWVNYELSYQLKKPFSPTQQQFHALNTAIANPATTGVPYASFDAITQVPQLVEDGSAGTFGQIISQAPPWGWNYTLDAVNIKPIHIGKHPFSFFQVRGTIITTFPDGWRGYQWNIAFKKPYPPLDMATRAHIFTPPPPPAALNWGFTGYQLDRRISTPKFPITAQPWTSFTPQGPIISVEVHTRFFIHNVGLLMGIR